MRQLNNHTTTTTTRPQRPRETAEKQTGASELTQGQMQTKARGDCSEAAEFVLNSRGKRQKRQKGQQRGEDYHKPPDHKEEERSTQ